MCGRETKWEGNPHRPFCSSRCKTADLAAWANEEYKIEAVEQMENITMEDNAGGMDA